MIKERNVNKFIKCGWPVKHLFGKYYLIKKYSPLTTGVRSERMIINIILPPVYGKTNFKDLIDEYEKYLAEDGEV